MTTPARLVHFSSKSSEWYTPKDFLAKLPPMDLDTCATPGSEVCPRYYTPQMDGLAMTWPTTGRLWMNPPYGRGINQWVAKAFLAYLNGARGACSVWCLLPARTDTSWFHQWCAPFLHGRENGSLHFIRGRLTFWGPNGSTNPAPFPSMLVTMGEVFNGRG